MKKTSPFKGILTSPWLAELVTVAGGIVFLAQVWVYAHTQISNLDEGNYLYKGYLFATGRYWPFQDYGLRTNHMPFSFLIPGYVQKWMGPGLGPGRYLAWFLSLLILAGAWILLRRLGGRWWAAAGIWALALNPAGLKMFSILTSQVQIVCLLVWALVLTLGDDRPLWQLVLGSILAGAGLLTRLNLAPLLPLLLLYVLWQYGWRTAGWAALAGIGIVALVHAIYWPGILRMWATWLPAGLTPFLNEFRAPGGELLWDPASNLYNTLLSFFTGLRFQFVPFIGFLFSILLMSRKRDWKDQSGFRTSVFLAALFAVLLLAHSYVSLNWMRGQTGYYSSSYCAFCFPAYLSFFSLLGLLLLALSSASWRKSMSGPYQAIVLALMLGLLTGIGFGAFESIGDYLLNFALPNPGGSAGVEPVPLWVLFHNKFGLTYAQLRRIIPTLTGFLLGCGLIVTAAILKFSSARNTSLKIDRPLAVLAAYLLLVTSFLLTPTPVLGGGPHVSDCDADVIQSYDDLGAYLRNSIPAGSMVYWQGLRSPSPLLYLPEVEIFPPQLNGAYAFYVSIHGSADDHLKHGSWNQELGERWLAETDYVLVGTEYQGWEAPNFTDQTKFRLVGISQPIVPCKPDQSIMIYQRLP